MTRHDQEDLEFLNLPDTETTSVVYNVEDGKAMSKKEYEDVKNNVIVKTPTICGKAITTKETGITQYYVLCNNRNQMFDPGETDKRYIIRNRWKFTKVKRTAFDTYVKFLQQHYTSLLRQAERGL